MERFRLANVSLPPSRCSTGGGDLPAAQLEWVQGLDRWMVHYYEHRNAVGIDGWVFPVEPETLVCFPPGVRATHARVGDQTLYQFILFDLPGEQGERVAIPLVQHKMSRIRVDWCRAGERFGTAPHAIRAFAWNLMWSIGRDVSVMRGRTELYAAEEWIYKNLSRSFSVPELAEAVGVSPRRLLTAFRQEHRSSIQEFIRQKRVQEAARLLATTDMPIKEIGIHVGIPDLQCLNKVVRMETGSSPRSFRALSRARPDDPVSV